ncbi:hypothetical protein Taro_030849 [Colocasia esculenta]|uniref:Uncharacterized protein n=1 Tax=Colocasia esculenta TaxID=4460 RepID=A0A843VQ88_COLES|nr:hypothetical protein [Colocasia esculenta]
MGSSRSRRGRLRVATGRSSRAARTRQGTLSRSDHNKFLCRDGPENVTYWAVAFSGYEPEIEREKDRALDYGATLYLLT